jgi:hypothetical protein
MHYRTFLTARVRASALFSRLLPVFLLVFAGVINALQPATGRQLAHHHRRVQRSVDGKVEVTKPPTGPLFAVVSIADQHVSFYDANGLWARSQVATGVDAYPTPTGIFTILEKERWHRSNIYSGAPMPFMQRVTWTGVALHEGVVPGRPASHGCIRLHGDFAKRLFGVTNVGQRVIISPRDVAPVDIVHAHLPRPKLQQSPLETVESVTFGTPVASTRESPATKLLNPIEFAQSIKAAAAAKASDALKAKKAAAAQLESKSAEARSAAKDLTVAQDDLRRAQVELENANLSEAKARGEEATQKAAERKKAAEAKLATAENRVQEVRDAKAAKDREVASLESSIRDADAVVEAAAATTKEAAIRLEPISIFISRKTRRLYVRQATKHLFDVPITIRDPERPLGTHLFIATRAEDDAASLRWVSLTPPAAIEVKVRPRSSRRGRRAQHEEEAASVPPFPETPSGALDRIEIPQDAAQRISELLWTGATIIISDVEMSGEGRFPMDFMILARTRIREP